VGAIAAAEAQPITDLRGSEAFRRELVAELTVRALRVALDRAEEAPA
jgi:CO/xanthine dehydrogenase FAD-binding subunit